MRTHYESMKERAMACSNKKRGHGGKVNRSIRLWFNPEDQSVECHLRDYDTNDRKLIGTPEAEAKSLAFTAYPNGIISVNTQIPIVHDAMMNAVLNRYTGTTIQYMTAKRREMFCEVNGFAPIVIRNKTEFNRDNHSYIEGNEYFFYPGDEVQIHEGKVTVVRNKMHLALVNKNVNQKLTNLSKTFRKNIALIHTILGIPKDLESVIPKMGAGKGYISAWLVARDVGTVRTIATNVNKYIMEHLLTEDKITPPMIDKLFNFRDWYEYFVYAKYDIRKALQKAVNDSRRKWLSENNGLDIYITDQPIVDKMLDTDQASELLKEIRAAITVLPNKADFDVKNLGVQLVIFNIKTKATITISSDENNDAFEQAMDFIKPKTGIEDFFNASDKNRTSSGTSTEQELPGQMASDSGDARVGI